ncbi:hypothetical protein pEaSNUABM52_00068 [Erwinia phage pEp_SNUABM_52]|nr:hypothetical protein pEaSNUABM52_00068 [Erwinia phage pEp_SNUABM_52]
MNNNDESPWSAFVMGLLLGLFLGLSVAAFAVKYGVFIKL